MFRFLLKIPIGQTNKIYPINNDKIIIIVIKIDPNKIKILITALQNIE